MPSACLPGTCRPAAGLCPHTSWPGREPRTKPCKTQLLPRHDATPPQPARVPRAAAATRRRSGHPPVTVAGQEGVTRGRFEWGPREPKGSSKPREHKLEEKRPALSSTVGVSSQGGRSVVRPGCPLPHRSYSTFQRPCLSTFNVQQFSCEGWGGAACGGGRGRAERVQSCRPGPRCGC